MMIAFSFGLSARIRSTTDVITSEHENCFLRIPAATSIALACHNGPVIFVSSCLQDQLNRLNKLSLRRKMIFLGDQVSSTTTAHETNSSSVSEPKNLVAPM